MLDQVASLWSKLQAREALLCLPALALVLAAGTLTHRAGVALVAATGALSVGFGSFYYDVARRPSMPMLAAAFGMALSAAVGSWVGRSEPALLGVSVLWAAGCAWLIEFGTAVWWIVLQWAVGLFIASAYPADLQDGAARGGLMLLGGALQFAIICGFWRLGICAPVPARPGAALGGYLRRALEMLRSGNYNCPYVVAAGLTVMLAVLIERGLHLSNGYWAPMTGLMVIRPDLKQTWARVLQRIGGTLVGAGLATLAAATLRPTPAVTSLLVLVFAWSAYASRAINYAVFSASITGAVVFLLSLNGLPEPVSAWHRVLATLLGALLALCVRAAVNAVTIRRDNFKRGGPTLG